MSSIKCRIMEMTGPTDTNPRLVGYAAFAQAPAGVIMLGNTLWQILGARWDVMPAPTDDGPLPEAVLFLGVMRQGVANLVAAPAGALETLKNGAGAIIPPGGRRGG